MRRWCHALAMMLAMLSARALARPVTDCPLRDAPFSASSPLIDILRSPAAKAALDREAPGLLNGFPPMISSTAVPSYAAILSVGEAFNMAALGAAAAHKPTGEIGATLARVNAALHALPVTADDRVARCQRYDNDRPIFNLPAGRTHLLLFEKINGFRDSPSVDAAHAALLALAKANGWAIVATDKGGAITPSVLRRFDAVIWNNISGDVLTLSQRAALQDYVEHGGAFAGVHGANGDPVVWWDWYVDTLIGARFAGHPYPRQFQTARVVIDNPADPIAQGLPHDWTMLEEWYSFKNNPRASGSHILATLDETSYEPTFLGVQSLRMGDHPIAWSRCVGTGRVFYSAIGHRPEIYADPIYQHLLTNAINWLVQRKPNACAGVP